MSGTLNADEQTRLLNEQPTESNHNDLTESEQNRNYARLAMERQRQINQDRRNNNRDNIRQQMAQRDQQILQNQQEYVNQNNTQQEEHKHQEPAPQRPAEPEPVIAGAPEPVQNQQDQQEQSIGMFSNNSFGLNMSFANMQRHLSAEDEKRIMHEFVIDICLLCLSIFILEMFRQADPKGCGIGLREWLMIFFALYFSRSTFQIIKIYVVRHIPTWRFYYDCFAFVVCNGAMLAWIIYGYDIFYSDKNNCDDIPETAFLNSVMFVILFIGYFLGFMYLMILCTLPCLYMMMREQAENNRLRAGGVGQAQVPMILASLPKTPYDPQVFQHENNCIICLVDYEQNDMVTQLQCDERHYFHTNCLENWIKQGNNICPFCRAPILNFQGNNNEEAESLVSSQDIQQQQHPNNHQHVPRRIPVQLANP